MCCLCIKHEHSHMFFKKNVSSIWIFKILNTYDFIHINHNIEFMRFLYEFMNFGKFVMIFNSRNLTNDKRPRWLREKGKLDARKNMCDFALVIEELM
jgi:hypothetical protein